MGIEASLDDSLFQVKRPCLPVGDAYWQDHVGHTTQFGGVVVNRASCMVAGLRQGSSVQSIYD